MSYATLIGSINQALDKGLRRSTKRLDGLAVPFLKGKQTLNLDVETAEPRSPDDGYQVHLFHIFQGSKFGPKVAERGRQGVQTETVTIVLIGYTDQDQLLDYIKQTLASLPQVALVSVDVQPERVNQQYLKLDKQPNATGPRQLFAVTYAATVQPVGGPVCQVFDL